MKKHTISIALEKRDSMYYLTCETFDVIAYGATIPEAFNMLAEMIECNYDLVLIFDEMLSPAAKNVKKNILELMK